MKNLFLLSFVIMISSMAYSQKYSRIQIPILDSTMIKMGVLGIPVEEHYKLGNSMVIEVSDEEISRLKNTGIEFEIVINDVQNYYSKQEGNKTNEKDQSDCFPHQNYTIPAHFSHGSMGGYCTLNEIYSELDEMHSIFPNLISVRTNISTFNSSEGRSVQYVRISDNPDISESETSVLFLSLTHAREPMGMQQLLFFMWYLLENYSTDDEIKSMIDQCQIYFIPCVNPDGYNYNNINNPSGGGMWRKNRRNNGDGSYGVDLNRNYGYEWGHDDVGSSPTGSYENYRGTTPFSEPETQAVKWFCENNNISFVQDYHTYSNVLLYPWGFQDVVNNDSILYQTYSKLMTQENHYSYGTPMECIGYNANGGSFDWMYGEQQSKAKIIAWGPEAGSIEEGFYPPESAIDANCQSFMGANLYMIRFALNYGELQNLSPRAISSSNNYQKYSLKKYGIKEGNFIVSLHSTSPNVIAVGTPKTYTTMNTLDVTIDSIAFTINSSVELGTEIPLIIELNNGLYSQYDTITRYYGENSILYSNTGDNVNDFLVGNWSATTESFVSPPSSISDSPLSSYANNANSSCTFEGVHSLYNALHATVSYYAKWDLEDNFDYVQFQISTDHGNSWTPLCSPRMNAGSVDQVQGEPLYDGKQNEWVNESFDIDAYTGSTVQFRFLIVSDGAVQNDGFYFDDFKIEGLFINGIQESINKTFSFFPNPVSEDLFFSFSDKIKSPLTLKIYDGKGSLVSQKKFVENENSVNVSKLLPDLYFFMIISEDKIIQTGKFSKQ